MAVDAKGLTKGKLRRLEWIVVGTIVAFAVGLVAVGAYVGFDKVWTAIQRVPLSIILALLGLSLFNYALRALRWHWFSRGLGLKVGFGFNAAVFIGGFALTTTPGKAGEALRLWVLEKAKGVPYERATPLFLGDRLSDMVAIMLLCLASLGAFSGYADVTLGIAAGLIVLMLPFLRPKTLLWVTNALYRLFGGRAPRLFAKIRAALRETAKLFTFRRFGVGLVLALIGWAAEAWSFQLLLQAVGGPEVSFQQASFVFTFALIAGTISMLPGGLGGAEAVMLLLLTSLGFESDAALAATAIIRLTTLWFSTALGFMVLPFLLAALRRPRDGALSASGDL